MTIFLLFRWLFACEWTHEFSKAPVPTPGPTILPLATTILRTGAKGCMKVLFMHSLQLKRCKSAKLSWNHNFTSQISPGLGQCQGLGLKVSRIEQWSEILKWKSLTHHQQGYVYWAARASKKGNVSSVKLTFIFKVSHTRSMTRGHGCGWPRETTPTERTPPNGSESRNQECFNSGV